MIDARVIEFTLSKFESGQVFEKFVLPMLSAHLGISFNPVGGIHDRGVDGFEYVYLDKKRQSYIYQLSIQERDPKSKVRSTIQKLKQNSIPVNRLRYVTNQKVKDKPLFSDELLEETGISVDIWDSSWFIANINSDEKLERLLKEFQQEYMHEYAVPGTGFEISDLKGDPRVYTFLRQQLDSPEYSGHVQDALVDTLILFALEGTDPNPDDPTLKTEDEIVDTISTLVSFNKHWLYEMVPGRIKVLNTKPRKIKFHKNIGYCLPYETRESIREKNIEDKALQEDFRQTSRALIAKLEKEQDINIPDAIVLLESILHELFRSQGLEFAEFIDNKIESTSIEKELPEIITKIVQTHDFTYNDRLKVRYIMHETIRTIVYSGLPDQQLFLDKLANTYRMLFLLQCDPQLSLHFASMSNKLNVYVGNSIIIPALSEYFLPEPNRRYWNLLVAANNAGVKLFVNDIIIKELISHFAHAKKIYRYDYATNESSILQEEIEIYYIDDILIRSYFYAKSKGQVDSFEEYLDSFVNTDFKSVFDDLVLLLKENFGIKYIPDANLDGYINPEDETALYEQIKKMNIHISEPQARSDARQLLMIYGLREQNKELTENSEHGYHTWWLTTDIKSQRAFREINQNPSRSKPYMRADFLHTYIALAPSKQQVDEMYHVLFPTLVGVNISYHIPPECREIVQQSIREHRKLSKNKRLTPKMRRMMQDLKANPRLYTPKQLQTWFEEQKVQY